jgi:signal transduction histidine kinase/CheY-like chemotaxis protein
MIYRFDSVVRITSLIAAGIALVITIVIPAGFFAVSYQYMIGSIDTHAELAARNTEGLVMANPRTWQFEELRLQELLQRHHDQDNPELRVIVDASGSIVARMTDPVSGPFVMRRCDIYDAGTLAGHIEISRSLRPLITRTMLVCAFSLLVGSCIFVTLRIIPLRAIRAEQLKSQKLDIQNRQLQKAESLSRMAGAIAHHFNNMIGAVIGNLELIGMGLPPESEAHKNLTQAMKAAQKAAEVSSLMLTYVGQTPVKHEPMDLSEACRLALSVLRSVIPNKVTVASGFPASGPIVRSNTKQIHLALTNLVTNARESIGDNPGTIELTVKTVSPANIPASHRFPVDWQPRDIPYACMAVADTGCGIADRDIEKIFDPFFSTRFTGRGMGLPVILGIVRAHDGVISVASDPDRGSVFRIFLPVSNEEIPLRPEKTIPVPKVEGGGTVLLIEDEELLRNLAGIMLSRLGYRVLKAKDGIEAVEIFRQHRDQIRFVLSDLTMPRMDGWETLNALRSLSPEIPVILSSGYDESQVMDGEHPERPNAFLGKPYQLKGLSDTINRVLSCNPVVSVVGQGNLRGESSAWKS